MLIGQNYLHLWNFQMNTIMHNIRNGRNYILGNEDVTK